MYKYRNRNDFCINILAIESNEKNIQLLKDLMILSYLRNKIKAKSEE